VRVMEVKEFLETVISRRNTVKVRAGKKPDSTAKIGTGIGFDEGDGRGDSIK